MIRVLFDTNVVLDVLLDRHPFVEESGAAWALVEYGRVVGMLSAHSVTTIHYLLEKNVGRANARPMITALLTVFSVATVDAGVIRDALHLSFADFEDSVSAAAARSAACDYLVTRDRTGFRNSPVRPITPHAILRIVS